MRVPSSSLTLVIWGACSNLLKVRLRTPDQYGRAGWRLAAPVFRICRFRGPLIALALEPLISRVVRGGGWPSPSFASAGFEGPWPCQPPSR
jgi:hypothetical protein